MATRDANGVVVEDGDTVEIIGSSVPSTRQHKGERLVMIETEPSGGAVTYADGEYDFLVNEEFIKVEPSGLDDATPSEWDEASAKVLYDSLDKEAKATPKEPSSPLKRQEGGGHYKRYPIQPVEYAFKNNLNYCQANVIKYVTRYKDKGGATDLKKAIHNIEILGELEGYAQLIEDRL